MIRQRKKNSETSRNSILTSNHLKYISDINVILFYINIFLMIYYFFYSYIVSLKYVVINMILNLYKHDFRWLIANTNAGVEQRLSLTIFWRHSCTYLCASPKKIFLWEFESLASKVRQSNCQKVGIITYKL